MHLLFLARLPFLHAPFNVHLSNAILSVGMAVCAASDSASAPPLPSVAGFAEPLHAPALSYFLKHFDGSSNWTLNEFEVGGGDVFVTN